MTDLRWYGWGHADKTYSFEQRPAAWDFLRAALDWRGDESFRACDFDAVRLGAPRLHSGRLNALRQIVPETKTDTRTRVLHAYGKSCRDLICLRRGEIPNPPDAVAYPITEDQIARVIAFCAQNEFALIPFGGGTNVVGGVEPRDARITITLDLAHLNRVAAIDEVSLTATIEAGILGPDLEHALNTRGFTLGHFPQSFEFSTLGGWLATGGAGLLSARYGNIESLVQSVRVVTPCGIIETRALSAVSAGSSLRQMLVGSEGTLGVITRATLRIHRLPKIKNDRAWLFRNFSEGVAAIRAMLRRGVIPATLCLFDEDETRMQSAFAQREEPRGWKALLEQLGLNFLAPRAHAFDQGALVVLGFEDDAAGAQAGQAICKSHGALDLGDGVAAAWLRDRYEMPYLRDVLMDHGVLLDTIETVAMWSNLEKLQRELKETLGKAIEATGSRGLVVSHIAPGYRDGVILSVTFLARMARDKEIEQWKTIRHAAAECITANGGTLSYQHGAGSERAAWMNQENGAVGMAVLRAVKSTLDPNDVMNPGRWLVAEPSSVDTAIEYQERFWNLPT